jgi:hypothetical protein
MTEDDHDLVRVDDLSEHLIDGHHWDVVDTDPRERQLSPLDGFIGHETGA